MRMPEDPMETWLWRAALLLLSGMVIAIGVWTFLLTLDERISPCLVLNTMRLMAAKPAGSLSRLSGGVS